MLRHNNIFNKRRNHRVWLYSAVFKSRFSIGAVFLLLLSFIVQPINQALAAPEDEAVSAVEAVAEEVKQQDTEVVLIVDTESDKEESSFGESIENELEPATDAPEILNDEDNALSEDVAMNQTSSSDVADEVTTSPEETAAVSDPADEIGEVIQENVGPSNGEANVGEESGGNEVIPESVEAELISMLNEATTSSPESITQAQNLVTEDNFYQFSRQSCVSVGGGTYHCSISENLEYDTQSTVYSANSANGNMEIFLRTARGEVKQITDNQYDDTAPHYDAETLQIVWQRLIDDRYQIISYDIVTGRESQLTYSRTNNMEPKVSSEGVVWQGWDGNDWEIMYFDGRYTEQITDNQVQDVNPVIQDGYILWSVIGRSAQEAKVYSLKSREIMTITGHEGGSIVNPRFVLVYDTKFDNGDIITQGFDPATGISSPIAAKPAPEPVDIPPIDPIGEIRALIQNKSALEDEQEFEFDGELDDTLVIGSTTKSSQATSTLDLSHEQESVPPVSTTTFMLSEYDLVIADDEGASSTESTQQ